jgi:hypothetical protein
MRSLLALCFVLSTASAAVADVAPCGRCAYTSRPPSRETMASAGALVGLLGVAGAAVLVRRTRR